MRLCATYLTQALSSGNRIDQVARFHLGNGARLERINWLGNTAPRAIQESRATTPARCRPTSITRTSGRRGQSVARILSFVRLLKVKKSPAPQSLAAIIP
jgi:hypothetical protein